MNTHIEHLLLKFMHGCIEKYLNCQMLTLGINRKETLVTNLAMQRGSNVHHNLRSPKKRKKHKERRHL